MFELIALTQIQQPRSAVLIKERQTLGTQKQGDQPSSCVPDNELFLECDYAFDFSKALLIFNKVPKTFLNFYISKKNLLFQYSIFAEIKLNKKFLF